MITLVLLMAVAAAPSQPSPECKNPALVVVEGATDIKRRACTQVEYTMKEAYPATGLISQLGKKIAADGWVKTEEAPAKPGSTHVWGEMQLKDAQKTRMDNWVGWFAKEKSRLQLTLSYTGRPPADKSPRPVKVRIVLITPETWGKSQPVKAQTTKP